MNYSQKSIPKNLINFITNDGYFSYRSKYGFIN